MRKLRASALLFFAIAFAMIGIAPEATFAAQKAQQTLTHKARRHGARSPRLRLQVRPQGAPLTPALVATPAVFEDKQGLDGSGPAFVIPITNTSATATIQVGAPTSSNPNFFNLSTTCATLAPGASCTLSLNATLQSLCADEFGEITIPSNDPLGPLLLEADVWGADNNFNITNLTDSSVTPQSLAQSLVGTGVTISNVTYTGAAVAAGTFQTEGNIIGFNSGIILSSGNVRGVIGPNCDFQFTTENATAGDTDLSSLIGQATFDAAVLEFDFVPTNPTIRFQYVFASEEYEDFVFDFNDVFAFFVNGKNVALIPQTNTLVSINTVNNGNDGLGDHPEYAAIPPVNPQFYVNNNFDVFPVPPIDTEMDGMTVVLTAATQVNPGVKNHIKLAIADALDTSLDSNVFIKAGSLSSSTVALSPTGFAFPTTNQGAQSPAQTVTLSNVGGATLTGVSVSPNSNNFTVSNNTCGTTVAAGATCTLAVSFSPKSGGLIQGTLNFTDSAGDSPQPVTLAGTGVSGPFASLSSNSLVFPPADGAAPPQSVTITNTGTAALTIGNISTANINGDGSFQVTQQNCISSSIPVNGSCTVQVTWTDPGIGFPESDQLIIQDDAPNGQQVVALVGGVTVSTITVAPPSLAFGNQAVNTTSAAKSVIITNTGNANVTIPSIVVPPGYAETDNCKSATLVPPTGSGQNNCTINVTFTPTSATTFGGNLTITDSAAGSPHTVALSGTGTSTAATLVSIAVTPNPATVAVNGQVNFVATGTFSDESTKDVTSASTWTSSVPATASIVSTTGVATGLVIGGPVTITAVDGNVSGTAQLTVTGSSVTLVSLAVTPATATIPVGGTQQFTSTGTFSDGSTKDLTTQSSWRESSEGETVTIGAATGLATGVALGGPVTITAFAVGTEVSGTAQLTVSNVPIHITITPPPGGVFGPVSPGGNLPVGIVLIADPGFSGTVTFGCTVTTDEGTPAPSITCVPKPASVTITPGGPLQVAIVITTFCKGLLAPLGGSPGGFGGGLALLLLSTMFAGTVWTYRRNPRWALSFALFLLIALGGVACNSLPRGADGPTPAGNYTLTITATVNGQTVQADPIHFTVN